jgi:hypothetical protein
MLRDFHPRLLASAFLLLVSLTGAAPGQEEAPADAAMPPITVPAQPIARTTGPIELDGDLSDAAWADATRYDTFYETSPGDNAPAKVRTVAWVTYDDRYLYIGVQCDDPDPSQIRAPFVDRDQVFGTDDNIAVFLDTRNDRKVGIELRVNPRGIQGDAVFNDATGSEDFAPDFFYDTAAQINDQGWSAEFRVPLTTLRYPQADPQSWRILFWRNYPRDFRYAFHSAPIPRGSNCPLICHAHELTGVTGLPSSNHLVVAPYATANAREQRPPSDRADFDSDDPEGDVGLDVKWNPSADSAIDLTVNPDFSQVEADVAQLEVNERFALSYPERRPFFLEGAEVFGTPLPVVFTRTVVDPLAGAKLTGKQGGSAYGVMGAQDQVNTLVFPANQASRSALLQQEVSTGVARYRRDLGGSSSMGVLFTAREGDGYHNRTAGLDGLISLGPGTQLRFQGTLSDTDYPDSLATRMAQRTGAFGGVNAYAQLSHAKPNWTAAMTARHVAAGFRADAGFIPRVDVRGVTMNASRIRWGRPGGWFNRLAVSTSLERFTDQQGRLTDQGVALIGNYQGPRQSTVDLALWQNRKLYNGKMFDLVDARWVMELRPSRAIGFRMPGRYGYDVDVANTRRATVLSLQPTVDARLGRHLNLTLSHSLRTLSTGGEEILDAGLTQAQVGYHFSSRTMVRAILQYQDIDRNTELHVAPVKSESQSFFSQFLFSYRVNPQTLLFLGYSDNHLGEDGATVVRTGRTLFLKLGYAWQL